MKKLTQFLIVLSVLLMLITPMLSSAQGLVPCNNTPIVDKTTSVVTYGKDQECNFNSIFALINNLIKFVLFYLAIPICAIMFAYAGILMVGSGGSPESRGKAKSIFSSAVIGLVLAAGAWLIVNTLLTILGFRGSWIGLGL